MLETAEKKFQLEKSLGAEIPENSLTASPESLSLRVKSIIEE